MTIETLNPLGGFAALPQFCAAKTAKEKKRKNG